VVARDVAVECLHSKCKALSSNPSTTKKKKKRGIFPNFNGIKLKINNEDP
jgi:hypothetical protein